MLKIEGKYLYLRAKLAHFVGHLPARSTGSLGRFRGWPSAVFSLLPSFAAPLLQIGGCQGLRSNPKGLALTP